MIYLTLFYEFFKIGLFSVGGGLATVPFLYDLTTRYDWFSAQMLSNMIAVGESTPGPIGVNIATYAGFQAAGVIGGMIATLGLVAPSLIVIVAIAHFLTKFKENRFVDSSFYMIRPVATGLIISATIHLIRITLLTDTNFTNISNILDVIKLKEVLLLCVITPAIFYFKKSPILYIGICAALGVFIF